MLAAEIIDSFSDVKGVKDETEDAAYKNVEEGLDSNEGEVESSELFDQQNGQQAVQAN